MCGGGGGALPPPPPPAPPPVGAPVLGADAEALFKGKKRKPVTMGMLQIPLVNAQLASGLGIPLPAGSPQGGGLY